MAQNGNKVVDRCALSPIMSEILGVFRLTENRSKRILWDHDLRFSFLAFRLRIFSVFILSSFHSLLTSSDFIRRNELVVLVQGLTAERTSEDSDGF